MNLMLDKLSRIKAGGKPRVLDLFSGCGGISLGFSTAGFEIVGAVEIDHDAAKSHAINFHKDSDMHRYAIHRDIVQTEPEDLVRDLKLDDIENAIDIIVGGPPCQAFSRVGRAKLREIDKHPEAFTRDPRGNLYLRYLHYVRSFKPVAILMENVPDILNYGGHNIAEEISETLSDLGYICRYTLLNAVHYGVPQMRERMFLVAFAQEINPQKFFPEPTHNHTLPRGYEGSRQVALKTIDLNQLKMYDDKSTSFIMPPFPSLNLPDAVTAKMALNDLPPITCHLEGKLKRGARKFTEVMYYDKDIAEISDYAHFMREWPGFENSIGVSDHVIRYLPRDYDIFERMKPGDQYPEAYEMALQLLNNKIKALELGGQSISNEDDIYKKLLKETVPPYDPTKFPNKWRKMEPDAPARTLMAHLGKDSYSHIHYDSKQKRTISVREAARLQSFPDGFIFSGAMNAAFRQIGNAVPPLLSLALAKTIMSELTGVQYDQNCIKATDSIRSNLFSMAL